MIAQSAKAWAGTAKLGNRSRWLALLGIAGASLSTCFYFTGSAEAAERAVLQYADRKVTVSLTELEAFAHQGEISPELADFIQQIPASTPLNRQLLIDDLPVRFAPSGDRELSPNGQFILYQINKLVGSPSGQPNYLGLRSALFAASEQNDFTILGVISAYPEPTVRVDLLQLEQVYGDVSLFLERLQPLFESRQLINDWLCECDVPAAAKALKALAPCSLMVAAASPEIAYSSNQLVAQRASSESEGAARIVITFGPIGRSLSMAELAEFAETGQPSRQLNFYLKLAKISPAEFQAALNKSVKVNFLQVESALSNILGEYLLFRISEVVHTASGRGNIPALRSALVLSAQDGQLSPIEVMQRYPTSELYINGAALLRASRLVNRLLSQDFNQVTGRVTDWLETLQVAIATEVCSCETPEAAESQL